MRATVACLSGVLSLGAVFGAVAADADCWHQDGQASYYGPHWNGRRTSSGARFDPTKLTAAHASLPLGTRLLVTSETTGDSVVVTVNDRQPDHGDRIIDLSRAAAERLHMIGSGVADVVISPATSREIAADDNERADEVADAPDDGIDQDVATPAPVAGSRALTHGRHGPRRRHHARR